MTVRDALLVLTDGTAFEGEALGATPANGIATGEVVFNTVLSGYQEVISDPSYAGQIITFTYPPIGNYGVNPTDDEAARPHCRGVVVRELARRRSNWRATEDLDAWLGRHGVPGIGGIDTRRLTRHIRDTGAMPGAFGALGEAPDGSTVDEAALRRRPGGAGHRRRRSRQPGHHCRAVHGRRRPAAGRGLRLRHQGDDPAAPPRASRRSRWSRRAPARGRPRP
ncbi:MAG: carbamoyl-phosphate synthase domain-containing protein [Acidimicrobiales bacterium]